MILKPPFPISSIAQKFGENAVSYYQANGLKGHTGIDFGVAWGTPIEAAIAAVCYSTMSKDNPNLMAYRAVFTIVDDVDCSYEISYGHCSEMYAVPNKSVASGDVVALVGNTGDVFMNGVEVTAAEKNAGSHAASHLHFQVRKLLKELASIPTDNSKHYVNDGFGLLTLNGYHYYVPEWDNGYNGCIDPMPFFNTLVAPAFTKDLGFGMTDSQVILLQRYLNNHGFAVAATGPGSVGQESMFFGNLTRKALQKFQVAHGISPALGYFGPITRSYVTLHP